MIEFAVNTTYQKSHNDNGWQCVLLFYEEVATNGGPHISKACVRYSTVTLLFMIHKDLYLHVRMAGYSNIKYSDEI